MTDTGSSRRLLSAGEVLSALGETAHLDDVRLKWEDSMAVFPGTPRFLVPEAFRGSMEWGGLEPAIEPLLASAAHRIAANPALCQLAWHTSWRVFDSPEAAPLRDWPELSRALGSECGLFNLLVALEMIPRVRAFHRSLGLPETVTRNTCRQIWSFSDNFRRGRYGRMGLFNKQLSWLRHYTREPLFRIGRLEFWLRECGFGPAVYRNRATGETVALAGDQQTFNAEGYLDAPPVPGVPPGGWVSRLIEDGHTVTGTPILPSGCAIQREVTLPLDTWSCVLRKGSKMLDMHIPAGGNLTLDACAESFRGAVDFFRRHYPRETPPAIVCSSWIFSPLLEEFMPTGANLVRFLRELYLYPVPSTADSGLWFIFFQDKFDPATAPRDSSLQRAMLDFILSGNRWRSGGMFFLIEDLPRFGTQHYRATFPRLF